MDTLFVSMTTSTDQMSRLLSVSTTVHVLTGCVQVDHVHYQKVNHLNPGSTGHFAPRWQIAVTWLVTTCDLVRPSVVLSHYVSMPALVTESPSLKCVIDSSGYVTHTWGISEKIIHVNVCVCRILTFHVHISHSCSVDFNAVHKQI